MPQGRSSKASHIKIAPLAPFELPLVSYDQEKEAVQEWNKGACRYTVNRAESGVGDSVPLFVRIGEKGPHNFLCSDL